MLRGIQAFAKRRRSSVAQAYPPGHFYSPVADPLDVVARREVLFDRRDKALPGIDLNVDEQFALLEVFRSQQADMPFGAQPTNGLRYGFENGAFSYGDGIALYGMLRHLAPARVIEVGSGWSSALMLDVNDRFLAGKTHFTFIEPFPELLHTLLRGEDRQRHQIIETPVQAVSASLFDSLQDGDLLFIDSTHVSRIGSDVNRLLLETVPSLAPGVTVHVHDVIWPFEYPEEWVLGGISWNEAYLLRALLIGNQHLRVRWFNSYLGYVHHAKVSEALPLWPKNPGGSIYLTVQGR